MQIIKHRNTLTPLLQNLRASGHKIGFVPTMGALHEGHISLISVSKGSTNITVCSIFVNPTQFNDPKDLEKYPRPIESDINMLEKAGCDILYLPEVTDIYPLGEATTEKFSFGGIETLLEGASRPGHFAGVAQVVKILLEVVLPDKLFIGQKDYQQCMVLTNLIKQMQIPTEAVICPIYRELHGLAMSSRNVRLSPELRKKAGAIYATLNYASSLLRILPISEIENIAANSLNVLEDFKVDYFEILNAENLQPIKSLSDTARVVIITSVIVGGVRLLDNLVVDLPGFTNL